MTEHENVPVQKEGVTAAETQSTKEIPHVIAIATPSARPTSTLPWTLFGITFLALIVSVSFAYTGMNGQKNLIAQAASTTDGGANAKEDVCPKDRMAEAVVTVDGVAITKEEVYDILYQRFGKSTLENLISDRVVVNKAKAENVAISDAELDAEIERIKKSYLSEAEFANRLKEAQLTITDVKKDLRATLYLRKLLEKTNPITEDALKKHFQKNKSSFNTPEQRRASHILVKTKKEAQVIKKRLDKGEDFAKVAQEKSIDPSGQNGGDLGRFGRGQMVPRFEEAAFTLEVNKISGIIETEFGFHIIKVTEKIAAQSFTFEQKKAEVREALQQQLVQEKSLAYVEKLKREAKIEKIPTVKE